MKLKETKKMKKKLLGNQYDFKKKPPKKKKFKVFSKNTKESRKPRRN
jgi:hypothetical protein